MHTILVRNLKELRIIMVSIVVQSLRQHIVPGVLLDFVRVIHCLIAAVLVSGKKNQVTDLVPCILEILIIGKGIFVVLILVREDVLNIVSIALPLPIYILLKVRRIAHPHVDVRCKAGKNMEHIPSRELIQTELCNTLHTNIHLAKRPHEDHTNRLDILVSDSLHHMEEQVFIGVPVDLAEIQNTDRSEVIYELCDHLDLCFHEIVGIVILHSCNNQHGLP